MSEMTMREKLARAFLAGLPDDFYTIAGDHPASCVIDGSGDILPAIDAVLDVLAEPDEGMIEAGVDVPLVALGEGQYLDAHPKDVWTAMINAARTPGAIEETGRRG